MSRFFSVHTVFFTVLGYSMSYIEFVGTLLYLWSVWLITRKNMLKSPLDGFTLSMHELTFKSIPIFFTVI